MVDILDALYETFYEDADEEIVNCKEYKDCMDNIHKITEEIKKYLNTNGILDNHIEDLVDQIGDIYTQIVNIYIKCDYKFYFLNGIHLGMEIESNKNPLKEKMIKLLEKELI